MKDFFLGVELKTGTKVLSLEKRDEIIKFLKSELDKSENNLKVITNERNEERRTGNLSKRNVKRLQAIVRDLNRQVQHLLKEIEEVKGNIIHEDETALPTPRLAHDVISQHLVTFKDIEELQTKNQQLLAALQDISHKFEEKEEEIASEKIANFRLQVKLEGMTRQQNASQILLTSKGYPESAVEELQKLLDPIMNEKALLQVECDKYKMELEEKERALQNELAKAQCEIATLRKENDKLALKLEYSEEYEKSSHQNVKSLKKENGYYKEQLKQHGCIREKQQATIDTLREELKLAHNSIGDQATLDLEHMQKNLGIKFNIGEKVAARNYKRGKAVWKRGTIVDTENYSCTLNINGQIWERNIDQIRPATFADPKVKHEQKKRKTNAGPSKTFILSNVFDSTSEDFHPTWDQDICSAVTKECEKFGGATQVHVDKTSKGSVIVRAPSLTTAVDCVTALHGSWLLGRIIAADYVPDSMFTDYV